MNRPMTPVIYTQVPRIEPALIERARALSVADLHEGLGAVLGRQCLLRPAMRPLFKGARLCGQAITCFNYPGDNLLLHAAIRVARAGDVIVATNGGDAQGALWGEMVTHYAQLRGLGGAVIDGAARDVDSVREMRFPVFSTVISASHPEKRGPGSANVPVSVAGVRVEPGDLIVGDGDGVLAIPPEHLAAAIESAETRMAKETALRERLASGATMYDLLGLDAQVKAAGIDEIEGTWRDAE